MALPENFPILAQLRSARTLSDRIAALRALKNEIVGHGQLKEAWIGLGVLEPIVRTIGASPGQSWTNGKDARASGYRSLSEEDAAKLQALQLVASFANGMFLALSRCEHRSSDPFAQVDLPSSIPCMPQASFRRS
jgi:hypothetical protein